MLLTVGAMEKLFDKPEVSVVVPTYNGSHTIRACLEQVFAQKVTFPFEVIVIDSGSTDSTLNIAREFPLQIYSLPRASFNHGATRNHAVQMCRGSYIVFLVQDAEPVGSDWMATLVDAVNDQAAAAAFGSQVPRVDASAYAKYTMSSILPSDTQLKVKSIESQMAWEQLMPSQKYRLAFFHNANSCIRRDMFSDFPFKVIPYGEDMEWASRVIRAGYSIVYQPKASVVHSHDRSVGYTLKRAYSDHSLVYELFNWRMMDSLWRMIHLTAADLYRASKWMDREPVNIIGKVEMYSDIVPRVIAQDIGSFIGCRSRSMLRYPFGVYIDKCLRSGV